MKGLLPVSEIVPKVIKSIGLKKKADEIQVLLDWNSIVGAEISKKTKPAGVKRGVLNVLVESSAWMNELQLMKPEIMAKIENRFGRNRIRDIKFSLGRIVKSNKT